MADKTAAVKEARAKAVKDAEVQAQELADAAGVTLGEIQNISFYDSSPYPIAEGKGGGGGAMAANTAVCHSAWTVDHYRLGQRDLRDQITASFPTLSLLL